MNFGQIKSRHVIKKIIIRDNLIPYVCAECNISEWQGKKLSLHLDHINGVNDDNRLENMRFLCPNCHSLCETYCGNNNKLKYGTKNQKVKDDVVIEEMKKSQNPTEVLRNLKLAGAGNYKRIYRLAEINSIEHMKQGANKKYWQHRG